MSRVSSKRRKIQLKIREKRKAKLAKLRGRYLTAKSETEKEKILQKARKLAPRLSQEEFLARIKGKK